MEKFCTKCGVTLVDDAKFCSKCGAAVRTSSDTQISHFTDGNNLSDQTAPRKLSAAKIVAIVIGIVVILTGSIWALIPENSVDSPSLNLGNTQTNNNNANDTYVVSKFCEDVPGIWMLSEEDDSYAGVYFISISNDMQMVGCVYPGCGGRICEITEIKHKSGNMFQATLYYPATEETAMDEAMPELRRSATFESSDGYLNSLKITYEDATSQEFTFVGTDYEKATVKFDQIVKEKTQSALEARIPKISASNTVLDSDFEVLKIRMGYDLHGPSDGWRSNAETIFYLKNMADVDCYMNISSKDEIIGVKDGEIVFYGIYGRDGRVKDLLPNSALTTEPAVYNISGSAGLTSYVWKLNNGYMAVVVISMNGNFYDKYVHNVAYVTDLSYLSYINY